MSTVLLIIQKGAVHYAPRRSINDHSMLALFSEKLTGKAKDSTFEELRSIPWKWHLQDDVIYPWGDFRGCHVQTIWTFDLDRDVLLFSKKDSRRKISLGLLRQRRVDESDFHLDSPKPSSSKSSENVFPSPSWVPKATVPERNKAFVTRILWDFAHQWRHVLRSDYNIHTFRRLACAIVRIATMDFRVVEVDTPRQGKGGHLVNVFRLPPWEPFDTDLLWIRSTRIVLTQDLDSAISLIRKDSASSSVAGNAARKTPTHQLSYLVLSVRYIVLCRVVNNILEYSKPEPFLNGIDPPSKMAVRLLLLATTPHYQPTPLHSRSTSRNPRYDTSQSLSRPR